MKRMYSFAHQRTCLILIHLFFCTSASLRAQAPTLQWQSVFESSGRTISDIQAVPASDDGYFVMQSFNSGLSSISKLTPPNTLAWSTAIALPDKVNGDSVTAVFARKLIRTRRGEVFIIGQYTFYGRNDYHFFLMQLAPSGCLSLLSTIKVTSGYYALTSVLETPDGGFLLAGNEYSFASGLLSRSIYRLNATGQVQWKFYRDVDRRVPGPYAYAAVNAPDGGYMLTSELYSYSFNGLSYGPNFGGIAKLTDNQTSGSIPFETYAFINAVRCILPAPAQNGYLVGSGSNAYSTPNNAVLAKTDLTGQKIWELPINNRQQFSPMYAIITRADTYIVGDNAADNASDIRLTKVKDDGTLVWAQSFGGSRQEDITSLVATQDGGYLVTGLTTSTDGQLSERQGQTSGSKAGWLMKFAPEPSGSPAFFTVQSGLWNDPAVWSLGRVPTATDSVLVGHSLIIPATYTASVKSLGYGNGGRLVYEVKATLKISQ
nr:hypothetical protein [uncultured Arsenicibacter sp.]